MSIRAIRVNLLPAIREQNLLQNPVQLRCERCRRTVGFHLHRRRLLEQIFRGVAEIGRLKRQHAERRERHAQPEKPRTAFAQTAVRLVENNSPHRRVNRINPSREGDDGSAGDRGKAVDVREKFAQVTADDEGENQLPGDIARGIAEPGFYGCACRSPRSAC